MKRTASDEVREKGSVSHVRLGRTYVPHKQAASRDSVQLLSHVQLFATPWTATCQASLSITNHHNYINGFIWKLENNNFKECLVIFIAENGLLTAL